MSTSKSENCFDRNEMVMVGEIARAHGRRGEVIVNPYSGSPERFSCLSNVFVENQRGEFTCYSIENMREHKNRAILKFTGISNIGEAEKLAGQVLLLPIAEFESTPDGNYYHFDIVGLSVRNLNQELIGAAEKVLSTGGTDVVVVRQINGKELLLPFCREVFRRIDLDTGSVEVKVPKGLFELNAH